jgi:hypothetical protein
MSTYQDAHLQSPPAAGPLQSPETRHSVLGGTLAGLRATALDEVRS